jgi:hypothetical protein
LPAFVQPQREPDEPMITIQNFAPSCFFLEEDGRCRVHAEHGREAKPYICRLFPANQIERAGVLLFVDTHWLCPLRPAREGDALLRHAELIADLQASIEVPAQLPSGDESRWPISLLVHEAFLRDLPIGADLLTRLARADLLAPRWDQEPRLPGASMATVHRAHLIALRRQMLDLVGLPDVDAASPRHPRELAILMPRFRLQLLRARPADMPLADFLGLLGRPMLALSVYLDLIAELGAPITLETVEHAWRAASSFCDLLSVVDRVPILPTLDGGPLVLFRTQEPAMQRFLRFAHEENPRRRLTLAELLGEIDLPDPSARVQLLQSFPRDTLSRFQFEPA